MSPPLHLNVHPAFCAVPVLLKRPRRRHSPLPSTAPYLSAASSFTHWHNTTTINNNNNNVHGSNTTNNTRCNLNFSSSASSSSDSRPSRTDATSSTTDAFNASLAAKVEQSLLDSEQQPDIPPEVLALTASATSPSSPASSPSGPVLPVSLDLLNYHARVASRRASTYDLSERLYRRCITLQRNDGRAWLGLARLLSSRGDALSARRTFRNGVHVSTSRNAHLLQAWGVFEERHYNIERAKGLYLAALRADSEHAPSWVALGLWHQRHGNDMKAAREAFRRGADADPSNYYVWHVWGVLERRCRRPTVARECFRKGVAAKPNNAATLVLWGCLEHEVGDHQTAITLFERAHRASRVNIHAYVSHAVTRAAIGDTRKAVTLLRHAIRLRPNDPAPRQALAMLHFRKSYGLLNRGRRGRIRGSGFDDSDDSMSNSSVSPSNTTDLDLMDNNNRTNSGVAVARKLLSDATRLAPRHTPTWHAWARLECACGRYNAARRLFQEAVWAAPRSAHVVRTWHAWGLMEMKLGRLDLARRYFAHGLDVERRSVVLLVAVAQLEAREGNIRRARECMENCVRIEPWRASVWSAYQRLEMLYGSQRRGQLVYERSVVVVGSDSNDGYGAGQRQQQLLQDRDRDHNRFTLSDPLPGDFQGTGMWIDPLELPPDRSAFDSIGAGSSSSSRYPGRKSVRNNRGNASIRTNNSTALRPNQPRIPTKRASPSSSTQNAASDRTSSRSPSASDVDDSVDLGAFTAAGAPTGSYSRTTPTNTRQSANSTGLATRPPRARRPQQQQQPQQQQTANSQ